MGTPKPKPKGKARRRTKRLTPEQKRLIHHSKPITNAGVGWAYGKGTNPIAYEEGWK